MHPRRLLVERVWTGAAACGRLGAQEKASAQAVVAGWRPLPEEGDDADEPTHRIPHGVGAGADTGRPRAPECGS